MKVKSFIEYKSKDLVECDLIIKHGKIQEIKTSSFNSITPYMNNSTLSYDIKIEKHYDHKKAPKRLKYFIKKSFNEEVFIIYLDISKSEYFKLKWQLKEYLIQSKEFKTNIIVAIISGIIGYITAKNT